MDEAGVVEPLQKNLILSFPHLSNQPVTPLHKTLFTLFWQNKLK